MTASWRRLFSRTDTVVLVLGVLVAVVPVVNGSRLVYRSAVTQPDQLRTLQAHGVTVGVKLDSCTVKLPGLPVSCAGSFRLGRATYSEQVSDVQSVPAQLPGGLQCTVDPHDPADVYPDAVVEVSEGSEFSYGPALFGGAIVALGLAVAIYPWRLVRIIRRARRRRRPRWTPHPPPPVPWT